MKRRAMVLIGLLMVGSLPFLFSSKARIPVSGATSRDWNEKTFWYEHWGRSGVHKGIDIFAARGAEVVSATPGIVLASTERPKGGQIVLVLGPQWRLHYYAHMSERFVNFATLLRSGDPIGRVGDTGNAKNKPPHLHYSVVTLIPYPWRVDGATQGWKKMFYLDPQTLFDTSQN